MNSIPLPDLVAQKGQAAVAEAFGVSPAAIHKAVRSGRKIVVTIHEDGTYTGEETRAFPCHDSPRSPQGPGQVKTPSPL
ncbi:Cro/Cl family transcriptional regulator [Pseudomonas sp. SDI]|uniref:Cro/CI family transcriptional regulator n=1 Tax=Pseudomonas sp. SDI TaxID=2170734 RepID=UPI000DE6F5DD|nr:Cro/CI family transcriptional regulator [Pseudomonas sp. SDI]PWB34650.1 Cro/Cl family transcriptional regulator [Pseudomonas sp. SDI]